MSFVEQQNNHNSEYQKELWNRQHSERGGFGGREDILRFDPNESAIQFGELIKNNSTILEIGSSNGRDARYWASEGHLVFCLDFSEVALIQLRDIAEKQMVSKNIVPILHDINCSDLPIEGHLFDGFYARSSLHIGDEETMNLINKIDNHLKPEAKILIMGKSLDDEKIQRSEIIDNNLAIDHEENGHLRRIWTPDFIKKMCDSVKWSIMSIEQNTEMINNRVTSFIKLIAEKNG